MDGGGVRTSLDFQDIMRRDGWEPMGGFLPLEAWKQGRGWPVPELCWAKGPCSLYFPAGQNRVNVVTLPLVSVPAETS